MQNKEISILICYWLRHNPDEANLIPDDFGWVNLTNLLQALFNNGIRVNIEYLITLNLSSNKQRWEIDLPNNRIRATHGHSINVIMDNEQIPPAVLYHGTATKSLSKINQEGILPINRQFVHLTTNFDTAYETGLRHGESIVLEIQTESMIKNGSKFFQTNNEIWLTKYVPKENISASLTKNKGK